MKHDKKRTNTMTRDNGAGHGQRGAHAAPGNRLSLAERDRRWTALLTEMQRRGFDALVFVGADSRGQKGALRYVADYDLSGRYGYAVLAPGAEPVCILPRSMAGMPRSTWVEDSRFPLNTASGLCEALKQLPSRERVGIVGRDAIMAIGEYEHLCAELPDTEFADASDLLDRVRAQKSEEEIRGLKESAWIADQCHQRLLEIARPGMTERALNTALVTVMAEHGGEDPIFLIMDERPGDGHSARYRVPRDEIVGTARLLMFSIELVGPTGYWVELSRMVAFAQPSDAQWRVHQNVASALEAGRAAMRPGASLASVQEAIINVTSKSNTQPGHWCGHSIGHDVIEAAWIGLGVVETAEPAGADAPTHVAADMAFALHPHLVPDVDGPDANGPVGYMSNTYLVGDDRTEALSRHPLDLAILG